MENVENLEKPEVLLGLDLDEDEKRSLLKKLAHYMEQHPDLESDLEFLIKPKPFVINAIRFHGIRYYVHDDTDMKIFFTKFYAYKKKREKAGYNSPYLSVGMGITLTVDAAEQELEYKYNGENEVIKEYLKDHRNCFYDFDIESTPAITQEDVDKAFSVLESLLSGGGDDLKAFVVTCPDKFPYKTFVKLTDRVYCKFDTGRTKFVDEVNKTHTLEEYNSGKYKKCSFREYVDILNKWGMEKVDESRVFERAFMEISSIAISSIANKE